MTTSRYRAGDLEGYLAALFRSRCVPPGDAARVAAALVETSLRGVDTHGVRLAPIYLRLLDAGRCRALAQPRLEKKGPSLAVLDADRALGHVAGLLAVDHALAAAREHGLGMVVVRNSNHYGAAACYTLPLARAGLIGFSATNADAMVVPFGGKLPFSGTNPLAIAAPGDGGEVFSLDMATSQTTFSRLTLHRRDGTVLERGWAVDAAGNETCDPAVAIHLSPLGGYKGAGLGLAVQILTALLASGTCDADLSHGFAAGGNPSEGDDVSHLVGALDIARFVDADTFRRRLSELLQAQREIATAGPAPVLAPGDLEASASAERARAGIPVEGAILAELEALAPGIARPARLDFSTQNPGTGPDVDRGSCRHE
jgi:LDH2 family malate/lactate/ureidoglycolate dehydrogenase